LPHLGNARPQLTIFVKVGCRGMLQHLFAVMNELLDDIMIRYSQSDDTQQPHVQEQLAALQAMSDSIVDGWLQVEEKLAYLRQTIQAESPGEQDGGQGSAPPPAIQANAKSGLDTGSNANATAETSTKQNDPTQHAVLQSWMNHADAEQQPPEEAERTMSAGQGYFKLLMFKEAVAEFRRTIRVWPDSVRARLYLAMSHMHLQEWEEAQRHFQLIVRWTNYPKWKALGLNALGCIHAVRANLEQAEMYFRQAHEADPSFTGAARNLSSCKAKAQAGHLSLYFGSAELSCM
jgi:tetratricopeptide (TPR) repeat protein